MLTIVLVTGVVGLVVAGHQPRNPIGWLLAGEAVFMLLSVAGGGYANLVHLWVPTTYATRRYS